MELLRLLIGTITLRPYVFIFFAIYLFIAVTGIGWKRTAVFTILAYLVALASEYSSTHGDWGIPFGVYRYIQATRDRELWIAGVPFMDSLSFTFLSYISYEMAIMLLSPLKVSNCDVQVIEDERVRRGWLTAALAGFLMMYLDIIIDPVTLQGGRWFLGQIYFYPQSGPYFGVTIANFIGWFVVCFVIVRLFVIVERALKLNGGGRILNYRFKGLAPASLYFAILGFNLWVTFRIGERNVALAGLFICLLLLLVVALTIWRARSAVCNT
jgi:uncharacterized membrane protein